ncbi:aldehyde dehydrogenase PuuC [Serratia odorifera]|uniref:Aldehyde dehydrogenase (NAD) family protein n=2 Tax=Serratia odorifera TaxID=618 RepID=D4E795_SEROD|nr:aldehyde dehydrogenase PuuC [Serratia odorifera]EFE94471.1 aldehyde dehydrogenase (NAD) family protein [Serratia odorifera DSM 4582]PNK89169.1 aldehyde dehydrogenase PuuC [Serratia odorifera]RII70279.1 aldehyde dehydrogenase PuuC [Serratia odorifera]VDZ64018.1 Aldehyde dehydrogenase PuuC [Serratia odorifera]
MDFHHQQYWQQRAQALKIENRLFINGRYLPATEGGTFAVDDPAGQRELTQVARATGVDVDLAVRAAREAFERGDWSQASPAQRKSTLATLATLMEQHAETLALLETLDTGKPIRHSLRDDIPGAIRCIRWYAEAIDKVYGEIAPTGNDSLALIAREPVGVVGAIVPWNFPLQLACWKLGPALATGNSVVLKPSEKSPLSAIYLAQLATQAGLPDGVLNVVPGYGHDAGKALALHHDVDALTFTGSTQVAKQLLIYAGESNMKRVWLEAGGKSANIIFADCPDIDKAAQNAAAGIFYNQGQVCIAGTRLLVEESIQQPFLQALRRHAAAFTPGDPLDPTSAMGTLIDSDHRQKVANAIERGLQQGATLFLDGRTHPLGDHDGYLGPTILTAVDNRMDLAREEIFGPVLAVTTFNGEQQAIQLANDSDYGLGAALWTRDLSRAHRLSRQLKAGSVFVNNYNDGDMTVPFGGYKQSGNGRDKSLHALEKFTELKTTWISLD